jgi:radical SAM-linked protein
MQRLRLKFSRGREVKYISHLDLMRFWERALRRAELPLAYSEGFTPHPRISIAAPLPLGVTSEAELMDVFLTRRVSPNFFFRAISAQLPHGIDVTRVEEVLLGAPSLQSQIRYAEYRVEVETEMKPAEVEAALRSLLQTKHLPWQHSRDTEVRRYDLRALIDSLWLAGWYELGCILGMRLRTDSQGAGRPEQVTKALGFPSYPKSLHRTKLILAERYR